MKGGTGYAFSKQRQAAARGRQVLTLPCLLSIFAGAVVSFWLYMLLTLNAERLRSPVGTATEPPLAIPYKEPEEHTGKARLVFYSQRNCLGDEIAVVEQTDAGYCNDEYVKHTRKESVRLYGDSTVAVDVFTQCHEGKGRSYSATLYPADGCNNIYNFPKLRYMEFVDSGLDQVQIPESVFDEQYAGQNHHNGRPGRNGRIAKARIVYSAESSEYFGYQTWANYYGFLTSEQSDASWTRLLTARKRDDLPDAVPGLATFQVKRGPYSRRYSPINKPDAITKWFASADRPKEEVIVVIDPDNWLLKDVAPWVDQVSKGHALGEAAYYHGSRTAQRLWRELCLKNCDVDIDTVGVPYVVHRDDLAVIAPLWRMYVLLIKDRLEKSNPRHEEFAETYKSLDVNWAAEMYGYNFASTHAGVKHTVIRRMQVRDVDGERRKSVLEDVAMIHVGRAWFPPDYAPAAQWAHTEGKSFRRYGTQVWCKCNYTASVIMPWPVPENADFQSTKTLELLHYSNQRFGPVPVNKEFRAGSGPGAYGHSIN